MKFGEWYKENVESGGNPSNLSKDMLIAIKDIAMGAWFAALQENKESANSAELLGTIEYSKNGEKFVPKNSLPSGENNKSSFQFPKLAEVDKCLISQYGVLNNRERRIMIETYEIVAGNKKP